MYPGKYPDTCFPANIPSYNADTPFFCSIIACITKARSGILKAIYEIAVRGAPRSAPCPARLVARFLRVLSSGHFIPKSDHPAPPARYRNARYKPSTRKERQREYRNLVTTAVPCSSGIQVECFLSGKTRGARGRRSDGRMMGGRWSLASAIRRGNSEAK